MRGLCFDSGIIKGGYEYEYIVPESCRCPPGNKQLADNDDGLMPGRTEL